MSYTYLAEKELFIDDADIQTIEDFNLNYFYKKSGKQQLSIGSYPVVYCGKCHQVTPKWKWLNSNELNTKEIQIKSLIEKQLKKSSSIEIYNNEDGVNYILQSLIDYDTKHYFISTHNLLTQLKLNKNFLSKDIDKCQEYTCPMCKNKVKLSDIHRIDKTSKWKYDNLLFDSLKISNNDDKIVFSLFTISVFPVTASNKLKISKINFRIVFNKKTKQIYILQPFDIDLNKFITSYENKPIKKISNITYLSGDYNKIDSLSKKALSLVEVSEQIAEYLCKENNTIIDNVFYKNYEIFDVLLYFRYYNCSKETRQIIKEICDLNYINAATAQKRKRILSEIYIMQNSYDDVIIQMKKKKCPLKKKLKKMILQNIHILYLYRILTKIGFKDYNVIISIIEQYKEHHMFFIKLYFGLLPILEDNNFVKTYFQWILKNTTDILAKKYIFDWQNKPNIAFWVSQTLDTARLYSELITVIDDNIISPLTPNKTNILHNEISRLLPKYKSSNVKIPYKKKDLRYNCDIDGISFRLAPDTFSLIDCGEQMGICVGGYRQMTLTKSDTIVFMIQNEKFVGCIELSPTNKLLQAKAKFNNKLQEKKALALKEWVSYFKIDASKCYDYMHILNDDIIVKEDDNLLYNHGHNYAISNNETTLKNDVVSVLNADYKIIDN